eukprot:g9000.t1
MASSPPPSHPHTIGGSCQDDKVPVAKPSLFKQLRQGREAGSAHPELQALEGEEQPSCLKEVTERVGGDPKAGSFLAPESGFPVPLHRAVGKSLGTALKPRRESSDEPEDEEEEIDLENRKMLMNTSPEEAVVGGRGEIDRLVGPEWQQQLLQHLGAETCELLRKRGQRKLKAKMPKTPALKRAEEEVKEPVAKAAEDVEPEAGNPIALETEQGCLGVLDRSELQKLQWTLPAGEPDLEKVLADASLPPEPCGRALQLMRFDFEGRAAEVRRGGRVPEYLELKAMGQKAWKDIPLLDATRGMNTDMNGRFCTLCGHPDPQKPWGNYTERKDCGNHSVLEHPESLFKPLADFDRGNSNGFCELNMQKMCADALYNKNFLIQARQINSTGTAVLLYDATYCDHLGWLGADYRSLQFDYEGMKSKADKFCEARIEKAKNRTMADIDLPKHLAEALQDPAQPVQLAALRATTELLDGLAEGEACGDVLRGEMSDSGPCCSRVEARSSLEALARKSVAVLSAEGFGGQGGGQSAWPPLLKRQLLGAKEEPEVTAVQVLEPLLPCDGVPALGRLLPPVSDEKQLALLARALASASVVRPELCARLLREEQRSMWIAAAESESEIQPEVIRFVRMSCEVVGRRAVACPLKSGSSAADALSAVEALRCWLSFLRCGAGCDRLDSFAAEIGAYWHRFAVLELKGEVAESHFLLAAHLLELTFETHRGWPGIVAPTSRRSCTMVEAASLAGGLSRSAGASPVQSPRTRARLQAKAAALAADLDSQLSVALKARQRLAPSWRPEASPAPNPRAVPLKAALPAAAVAPAPKDTVDNGTRTSSSSSARLQALERQLEDSSTHMQGPRSKRHLFANAFFLPLPLRCFAMMPKWIFALAIFIVAALGALAAKLAERKGGRLMALAEAFVAGGLLNAALVHLLADNIGTLEWASVVHGKSRLYVLVFDSFSSALLQPAWRLRDAAVAEAFPLGTPPLRPWCFDDSLCGRHSRTSDGADGRPVSRHQWPGGWAQGPHAIGGIDQLELRQGHG